MVCQTNYLTDILALLWLSCMLSSCIIFYSTPLHRAIVAGNEAVFSILLEDKNLNLEAQDCDGHTVLWLALTAVSPSNDAGYEPDSFAARLVTRGSSPNTVNQKTGGLQMVKV